MYKVYAPQRVKFTMPLVLSAVFCTKLASRMPREQMEDADAEAAKSAKAIKYLVVENIAKFESFLPKFEIMKVENLSG